MTTLIELATLASILALGVILLAALHSIRRKVREVESTVRSFVSAPDAQTPSPLAQTIDAAAQVTARAIMAQARTTMMGVKSGEARAQTAAMTEAAKAQFPWLSVLENIIPGASKTLIRNPQLLNMAANALKSRSGVAPGNPSGNNGKPQETLFNL